MLVKIINLLTILTIVHCHDVIVGLDVSGRKIFDEKREASPAIWRQSENVTINASEGEVISRVVITDLRPEKDGDVKVVNGGEGQKNVTIELKSPTVLRGFDFHIEAYAVPEKNQDNFIKDKVEHPSQTRLHRNLDVTKDQNYKTDKPTTIADSTTKFPEGITNQNIPLSTPTLAVKIFEDKKQQVNEKSAEGNTQGNDTPKLISLLGDNDGKNVPDIITDPARLSRDTDSFKTETSTVISPKVLGHDNNSDIPVTISKNLDIQKDQTRYSRDTQEQPDVTTSPDIKTVSTDASILIPTYIKNRDVPTIISPKNLQNSEKSTESTTAQKDNSQNPNIPPFNFGLKTDYTTNTPQTDNTPRTAQNTQNDSKAGENTNPPSEGKIDIASRTQDSTEGDKKTNDTRIDESDKPRTARNTEKETKNNENVNIPKLLTIIEVEPKDEKINKDEITVKPEESTTVDTKDLGTDMYSTRSTEFPRNVRETPKEDNTETFKWSLTTDSDNNSKKEESSTDIKVQTSPIAVASTDTPRDSTTTTTVKSKTKEAPAYDLTSDEELKIITKSVESGRPTHLEQSPTK